MTRTTRHGRLLVPVLHNAHAPLLALAGATVVACLVLSHRIGAIHQAELAESKVWLGRTTDYVALRGLAGKVNASADERTAAADPGPLEAGVEASAAALEARLPPLLEDLRADKSPLATTFLPGVEAIASAARDLLAGARDRESAVSMDNRLIAFNAAVTKVTNGVRAEIAASGDASLAAATRLEAWQTRIAVVAGPIMLATGAAGWWMSRRLARSTAAAGAALREFEALRSTVDAHSLVSVADPAGRIIEANDRFCRASGYSRHELIGQDHRMLNSGVHPKAFWAQMWRTIAGGKAWRAEVCDRARDGTLYWVDAIVAPFTGADGRIEKFVSIRTDITEARRIRQSLAQFKSTLDQTIDCVYMFRPADLRYTYANQGAMRQIGYTRDELLGMTPLDIKPGFTPERFRDMLAPLLDGTLASRTFETVHRHKDGHDIPVEIVLQCVAHEEEAGRELLFVAIVRDITERLRIQSQLIGAQAAAESASRAKSEFLANMSHEIRTPLTAILGFTDMLREDENMAAAPEGRVQTIDTIRNAGNHLLTVINDILDLSKIEADKMTVERIHTPLVGALREVESLMRPRAIGKGVSLGVVLATPVPETVIGDPTRLRQILMNLAGNAVKFTEAGGVTIIAGVRPLDGASRLVIDVDDTGPGMSPEQAGRLFSAFGQADSTMSRKHGGTGLGLTISRRLANLMGGDVSLLRTAPGRGSCFRLSLPLEPAPDAPMVTSMNSVKSAPAPMAAGAQVALGGRILLAEDGPDNQRLIAFHLRKAGAEVELADNGRVALMKIEMAEAAGRPFDLLLTDMQMPEMDGYTLARTLRQRESTLAIVALTAHAMSEDRNRCLAAGCDAYTNKPIDKAKLLRTCAAWVGKPGGRPTPVQTA
ncbi:MAG TPA: PAS domain S-box protein [Phycisphaerales bacterium]|nr:PAS domain S-box protein [Phycisphaerales bacterium]